MSLACKSKVYFDTEWEATLGANHAEAKHGVEMMPYQCGAHWHITHKDRTLSRGYGNRFTECWDCGAIMKRSKIEKHRCKGRPQRR